MIAIALLRAAWAVSRLRFAVNVKARVAIKHPILLDEKPLSFSRFPVSDCTQHCQDLPRKFSPQPINSRPLNPSLGNLNPQLHHTSKVLKTPRTKKRGNARTALYPRTTRLSAFTPTSASVHQTNKRRSWITQQASRQLLASTNMRARRRARHSRHHRCFTRTKCTRWRGRSLGVCSRATAGCAASTF